MIPSISRSIVFPLIFALRGEKVFQAIESLEKSQWLFAEEMQALQLEKLTSLLYHAYSAISFYREIFDQRNLKPGDIRSLEDLKLLPLLGKEDVARLSPTIELPRTTLKRYNLRQTAGTSGVPVTVFADNKTNTQSLAARYRSQGWFDLTIEDRQARFWGRPITSGRFTQVTKDMILNRLRVAPEDLGEDRIDAVLKKLIRFDPAYFYGYSSMIVRFGDYLDSCGYTPDKLNLKAVICTSEMIMKFERERLSRIFGCPVIGEYGCSETDIIAFECPSGSQHIIAENVIVEVLTDDNSQDGMGEIVVTDLNNFLMPMIRYRLGDLGSIGKETCECGRGLPILKGLAGRTKDQYIHTPNGKQIHSVIFAYFFENLVDSGAPVKQFLVVQEEIGGVVVSIALEQDEPAVQSKIDQKLQVEVGALLNEEGIRCESRFCKTIESNPGVHKTSYFESRLEN